MNKPAASARVLLVEGVDDKHVIMHLRKRYGIPEFDIEDKGGIDQVLSAIEPELKAPNRQTVGILVDANDSPASRWQALTHQLERVDVTVPSKPDAAGTIIEGTPRIGVWLMPDNSKSGELEDFVKAMIPQDDAVWPRSEAYIEGIPMADRRFRPGKTLRAKVHSWLATREEPRPMGSAIRAQDLDVSKPGAVALAAWLQQLFGE